MIIIIIIEIVLLNQQNECVQLKCARFLSFHLVYALGFSFSTRLVFIVLCVVVVV